LHLSFTDDFESPFEPPESGSEALIVDLGSFEGPLDLLLTLARKQKVDLAEISILALAEQYLSFIDEARELRLEVAADYLVMAAWLTYLKSRLLLPKPAKPDEPDVEILADELAARLQRLELMRLAGEALMARPMLGRDVFARGAAEVFGSNRQGTFTASIYDLLSAYGDRKRKLKVERFDIQRRKVWSLAEARETLARLIGRAVDWFPIDAFLLGQKLSTEDRRSARASAFAASLEMAREGDVELRQDRAFAALELRAKPRFKAVS
jgi:segregation and condensation protein A